MLENAANSTHGSTDVLTQASDVETGYSRVTTAVLRSVSKPTEEAISVLPAYTNMTIQHSALPLFHYSTVVNLMKSIQTLYLNFRTKK